MSALNQSGEDHVTAPEQVECPLCMEPLEVDDLHFYPCTCGYQICRFCWNRIREIENGLCPACRKAYPENPADFTPLSQEQVAAIKTEKKAREQKRRNKTLESRRALANVRVVQNNLVFVVGLPVRLADPEILKRQEYFGKYGKIHKVVINQSNTYAGSQGPSASAYVTYVSGADALRAIQGVNNVALDGRVLKGSLGTTKYCANFMKNTPCPKPDCMYLHDLGDPKASFTKEEMHAGLHQVYERKLHQALLAATASAAAAPPAPPQPAGNGNSTTNGEKASSKEGNQSNFIPTTVVTSSHINVVNSSRSKKDSVNGNNNNNHNTNGNSNGTSSSSSSTSGSSGSNNGTSGSNNGNNGSKDAWPSLSSSPPSETITQPPNKTLPVTVKSQDQNGQSTSESSSPTQQPKIEPQPKRKEKKAQKTKEKTIKTTESEDKDKQTSSVFETQYINNDLDELESDRHSLLENHDLLENSDHSLLDDDSHSLLNDVNNEVFQRHRDYPENKPNGFGMLDREIYMNDRMMNQGLLEKELMMRERNRVYMPSASIAMDSNDLLGANYHPNHNILPPFGMRVDNSLGNNMTNGLSNNMANSMANHMAVNSITSSLANSHLAGNTLGNMSNIGNMTNMGANTLNMAGNTLNMAGNSLNMAGNTLNMAGNTLNMGGSTLNMGNTLNMQGSSLNMPGNTINMAGNSLNMAGNTLNMAGNAMNMGGSALNMGNNHMNAMVNHGMPSSMTPFMMHNQQMMQNQQMQHQAMVNGYDGSQNTSEGRYLAENMDKFFTDFRQAQQMRLMLGREPQLLQGPQGLQGPGIQGPQGLQRNMLSAARLEMDHKQGLGRGRLGRAAGDADDDLDFDPFKETQKALAEMMESEMMQGGHNGESERMSRLVPPGFAPVPPAAAAAAGPFARHHVPQQQQALPPGFVYSDWTAMDPAIVSTSAKPRGHHHQAHQAPPAPHSPQTRNMQIHNNKLGGMGGNALWAGSLGGPSAGKLWGAGRVPLPPGFAPQPSEIDAK